MPQYILIIDDDRPLADSVAKVLRSKGYQVYTAYNGHEGLNLLKQVSVDLLILDRVMPRLNGLEVCRQVSAKYAIPIIMFTTRSNVDDKVEGLDAGASDYLSKPFEMKELLARIRAHLRDSEKQNASQSFVFKTLELFPEQHKVIYQSKELSLSPREFELLQAFMDSPEKVQSKNQLINKVWGWEFNGNENIVEVYIRNLRKKLEANKAPRLIHTVHGVGYILK